MSRRTSTKTADRVKEILNGRSIIMIGLMGAGKTIPEIFEDHGEQHFRDGERRVIARLLASGQQVLATGGGAYMNEETRRNIAETGLAVWLRADLDLLMKRVRRRSNRPLLNTENPEAVMRKLIEQRYPVYGLAEIIVDSRDVPHNAIVSEVLKAILELEPESECTT